MYFFWIPKKSLKASEFSAFVMANLTRLSMAVNLSFTSGGLFFVLCSFLMIGKLESSTFEDPTKDPIKFAPIIELKNYGKVRGVVKPAPLVESPGSNSDVYLYQGIRYGQAKRFERPVRAQSWNGVFNATKYRDACPQPGIKIPLQTNTISEDCLYLNVWTSEKALLLNQSNLLPVMVWIHGGFFRTGTIFSEIYDGGVLASDADMIIVSIAYRLGPFGFLYSGDQQAQGNQGLHDQILALKWVQENIDSFGGDPKQVTIFGQSAGSMSVGALVLSPLASGLFNKAILQSGAPNSDFGCGNQASKLRQTLDLSTVLGCYSNGDQVNSTEIINCLRRKSMNEIIEAEQIVSCNATIFMTPLYGDDLLPISPVDALKSGKGVNNVDLMFGVVRDEGTIFVAKALGDYNLTFEMGKNVIRAMMSDKVYAEEVATFYTKDLDKSNATSDQMRVAVSNVFGDYNFVCPTIFFGEAMWQRFPDSVHFYSYRLMLAIKSMMFGEEWTGVSQGQDIFYIFGIPFRTPALKFDQQEKDLSRDMIMSWKRFAKNGQQNSIGKRNIQWTEAFTNNGSMMFEDKDSSPQFMSLNPNDYQMVKDFFKPNCDEFWRPKIFKGIEIN